MEITLLYTTVENGHDAERLIRTLLDQRMVACGVRVPASAAYEWHAEVAVEEEVVIFFKTTVERASQARAALEREHPYDVPMILSWNVQCNQEYASWVEKRVSTTQ